MILNRIVYNPHDNYTKLTVAWFRSINGDTLSHEVIPNDSVKYHYLYTRLNTTMLVENCSLDTYKDIFSLVIYNFTSNNNGYYWFKLVINGTYTQRSPHAQLYAVDSNLACNLLHNNEYFRQANKNESHCARFEANNKTTLALTLSIASSMTSLTSESLLPASSEILSPTTGLAEIQ